MGKKREPGMGKPSLEQRPPRPHPLLLPLCDQTAPMAAAGAAGRAEAHLKIPENSIKFPKIPSISLFFSLRNCWESPKGGWQFSLECRGSSRQGRRNSLEKNLTWNSELENPNPKRRKNTKKNTNKNGSGKSQKCEGKETAENELKIVGKWCRGFHIFG